MTKTHLYFVTTNLGKFEEVQTWIAKLLPEIELERAHIDVVEIQSLDVNEVARAKAETIWPLLKKPFLVDDGGIYLERYNKFPGTLSKYVYQGIGLDGLWKLTEEDPRAYFLAMMVYAEGPTDLHFFEGICRGHLIAPTSEIALHPSLPFTKMLVPQGYSQTIAEMRGTVEEEKFHHRYQAIKQFAQWRRSNKS